MSDCALVGRCGLYCGACVIYRAYRDEDRETQERIAERAKCRPEQVRCNGCSATTEDCWGHGCKLAVCSRERELSSCDACEEIKECDKWQELNERYAGHPGENIARWAEVGFSTWLKEQEEQWSCPSCCGPIAYYWKACRHCGAELPGLGD